ncbi:MAG: hypothetical protein LBI02_11735 [Opitutaceae bacterium]|nr:hypothetical protein [Opitutaceae bacterium]
MKSTYLRASLLLAMFAGLSVQSFAQDIRPVPIEYLRPMKNSVSIGVRAVGGARVKFSGNLGGGLRQHVNLPHLDYDQYSIPIPINELPVATDSVTGNSPALLQIYTAMMIKAGYTAIFDNGSIMMDSPDNTAGGRPPSRDTPDTQMMIDNSTQGSWYKGIVGVTPGLTTGDPRHDGMAMYEIYPLSNGNTIPDPYTGDPLKTTKYYLPYDANRSRNWSLNSRDQYTYVAGTGPGTDTGQVTFGRYWTEAAGNEIELEDGNNPGVEFRFERILQRFKRFEWGLAATAGISEFNAKTRQGIQVRLRGNEYTYNLSRPLPDDGSTGGPTFTADETEETTAAIGIHHDNYNEATDTFDHNYQAGGTPVDRMADVHGYWQMRGVYYLYRAGPFIRVPLTRKLSLSASAGYMGAYVGSKFRYEETMRIPEVTAAYTTGDTVKTNQRYVSGYYGDLNLEWWLSTRTGFYAGAAYEKMGDYTQIHAERRADVKMDGGAGFRFGIITRF